MTDIFPTPYRISTITATGCVGTAINLDVLYNCLQVQSQYKEEEEEDGIVYVEYGKKKSETIFKGFSKKYAVNRRKIKPTKRFDNQVTIVYRNTENSNLNIKTFRNGNVQITGIKSIDQGSNVVDKMIEILQRIHDTLDPSVIENVNDLKNTNYKIRLINTDYKVGFGIRRDILHRILQHECGNICDFEPVIYPGVKLHYFYNTARSKKDGLCVCSKKCNDLKGGEGCGDSNCKKITIAIFQSGCIIITGSQSKDQIDECYEFINDILYRNKDRIEKKNLLPLLKPEAPQPKKIVMISKAKIMKAQADYQSGTV